MPLRALFRYLANNERLVQKLAESYPVRRAAQLAVSVFYRGKVKISDMDPQQVSRLMSFLKRVKISNMDPQQVSRLMSFLKRWRSYVKEGIEDAKKQIKK